MSRQVRRLRLRRSSGPGAPQEDLGTRSGSQGAGDQERLKRISGPGARVGDSSIGVAPEMTEKSARGVESAATN